MRNAGQETEVGTIISEVRAFDHKFFLVVERVVKTPDGIIRDPQLLWDRGGKQFAVAVATDENGNYILVEEPKFGQMRRMVSAPTGAMKAGEKPEVAARRELLEETGYVADHWEQARCQPFVDFADKSDGGEHLIFYARAARKHTEPRGLGQRAVLVSPHTLITELIPSGTVPAMSIAALLLPG